MRFVLASDPLRRLPVHVTCHIHIPYPISHGIISYTYQYYLVPLYKHPLLLCLSLIHDTPGTRHHSFKICDFNTSTWLHLVLQYSYRMRKWRGTPGSTAQLLNYYLPGVLVHKRFGVNSNTHFWS